MFEVVKASQLIARLFACLMLCDLNPSMNSSRRWWEGGCGYGKRETHGQAHTVQ